jgi:hypothetical protein
VNRAAIAFVLVLAPALATAQDARLARPLRIFEAAQQLEESTPSAKVEIQTRYRAAANAFVELHTRDRLNSARLFTNAGNAYYFAGDLGDANLWFSRALVLDPENPRALAGRQLVRRQLPWQPPVSVGEDLLATLFFWHTGMSFSSRRALFLVIWPLVFLLLALGKRRRWVLGLALLSALAGVALLTSLALTAQADEASAGCVLRVSVEGRSGDGKSYSLSHSAALPAGSEARALETRASWVHVALPDGTEAWIPRESVAWVIPAH